MYWARTRRRWWSYGQQRHSFKDLWSRTQKLRGEREGEKGEQVEAALMVEQKTYLS